MFRQQVRCFEQIRWFPLSPAVLGLHLLRVGVGMGRSKGIVEVRLEPQEVDDVAKSIQSLMPEVMKGACSVDPTKLFGGFAVNSISGCTRNLQP